MGLPGAVQWVKWGDTGQSMHTFSYKMSTFWGSAIQHGGENEHYCIVYLKFPNRVGLKYFPPVIFAWKFFLTLYTIIQ